MQAKEEIMLSLVEMEEKTIDLMKNCISADNSENKLLNAVYNYKNDLKSSFSSAFDTITVNTSNGCFNIVPHDILKAEPELLLRFVNECVNLWNIENFVTQMNSKEKEVIMYRLARDYIDAVIGSSIDNFTDETDISAKIVNLISSGFLSSKDFITAVIEDTIIKDYEDVVSIPDEVIAKLNELELSLERKKIENKNDLLEAIEPLYEYFVDNKNVSLCSLKILDKFMNYNMFEIERCRIVYSWSLRLKLNENNKENDKIFDSLKKRASIIDSENQKEKNEFIKNMEKVRI